MSRYRKTSHQSNIPTQIKTLILVGMILLAGCGVWFLSGKIARLTLNDPYQESYFTELLAVDTSGESLDGYARNLAVVDAVHDDESLQAGSALLVDESDATCIFSKSAMSRANPASTTKIMTALLALKYGKLSDMVTITSEAMVTEAGASLAKLKVGDKYSLEQLLYGLMLPSGNDAANAIAIHIAGSTDAFADMMNEEAERIGALGSHFTNPHGLTDSQHYMTAYDLYLIFHEAMKYDTFRIITGSSSYTVYYEDAAGKACSRTWSNGNRFISKTEDMPEGYTAIAGKTGTTLAAGNCLVLGAEDGEGHEYTAVCLKSPNRDQLYENMRYMFKNALK
jgi:serine-type D-Ala-D-Ala carboxypeptidase (penicillin-binding protein 5/6)